AAAIGLLASLFTFLIDFWIGTVRLQVVAPLAEAGGEFLATAIWYLVAGAGLVGGALVLLSPLSGGLLLLAAACGWLALGVAIPEGFGLLVLVPLALCFLASVAAIAAA